jgi:hypothetical protein
MTQSACAVGAQHGAPGTRVHLGTDHSYSDRRVELAAVIVRWLGTLKK